MAPFLLHFVLTLLFVPGQLYEKQYQRFKVSVNRELQQEGSDRSTRHIELRIPHFKAAADSYVSGDHFAVYPRQPTSLVESFAKRIGVDLESHFVLQPASLKSSIRPPAWSRKPMAVRQYLSQLCDLSAAPTRKQLEVFAGYAKDKSEAETLRDLSSTFPDSIARYEQFIIKPALNVVDLLTTLGKTVELSFAVAIEVLSSTKPRFYSISSSPLVHGDKIHLTVGLHQFGADRAGLCSSFLAGLKAGDRVYGSIKACPTFRLPKDPSSPIICIGAGTGVAPFRAFLHERAHLSSTKESTMLIFGCRADADRIYQEEWQQIQEQGSARIEVAYSRKLSDAKEYVQHRLKSIGAEVFNLIDAKNASIYVCGDGRFMAKDVAKALVEIAVKYGAMPEVEAQNYVDGLTSASRYLQDVWG